MKIRDKFTLKININDMNDLAINILKQNCKLYCEEKKIKLEINFWYDKNCNENLCISKFNILKSELTTNIELKIFNFFPPVFAWYNIINKNNLYNNNNYKFISTYENSEDLIKSLFLFFSYLSATINR